VVDAVAALVVAVAVVPLLLVTSVPSVVDSVLATPVPVAWAWVVVWVAEVAWAVAAATAAAPAWAWAAVVAATATPAAAPAGGRTSAPRRLSLFRLRCCTEHQHTFPFGVSFSDFAIKRALLLGYQISMMDLR
jgi:hypothetical protein